MMNERIKELAYDCFEYFEPNCYGETQEFNYNKFAELIIRECITVTKNVENGYSDYRDQIEDGMRAAIISNIEYHFGIKE